MTYSIFDSGNLVVSYDEPEAAQEALTRLAAAERGGADRLLLIAFDDDGHVVDEFAPGEHIAA
jgi:hypothetical protein